MRIYDIHNQHPEWLENPKAHRAEIREVAHAYVMDIFNKAENAQNRVLLADLNMIANKLESIMVYWDYQGNPEAEAEDYKLDRARRYILEKTVDYIRRYLILYEHALPAWEVEKLFKKNRAFKDIIEWPIRWTITGEDDFKNIIFDESEKSGGGKKSKPANYLDIGDELAGALYKELSDKKVINDCALDVFLWYFGEDSNRKDREQPGKIEWYGGVKDFAYFALILTLQIEKNVSIRIDWKKYEQIFSNSKTGGVWDGLAAAANKMKSNANTLPAKLKIGSLEIGNKLLAELRKS